ncbi:hypothetical protein A8C56_23335 [Niabella ginsenosidivorans]|uniref:Uncharacterized protein n=1 Tax=Niabella ginsenosidivorans TaxID=1176587 RepID=A0A1A9I771_9BACT|nr:hypothetical protein [Niabella ginsenosidivorans]ANH83518.1 hypothetical protein A8C56_23335 [Niabella ginsenosidivorans]
MKKYIPFLLLILLSVQATAQKRSKRKKKHQEETTVVVDTIPAYKPVITRLKMHETIDADQKALMGSDGNADGILKVSEDKKVNEAVTDAATKRVDWLQYQIETDPNLDNRLKANYLSGISEILKYVKTGWKRNLVDIAYLPQIIATYKQCIEADRNKRSVAPIIQPLNYDVAYTAILPRVFKENPGYEDTKDLLLVKLSEKYPERTFAALKVYPQSPHADSLIRVMAHKYPQQLYDYAQANNKLSYRIQNIEDDPLITSIVAMARSDNKSGQYYFPFLDNIVNGKITTKDIDDAKNDPVKYFRLLVNTQIEYTTRMANGDTAMGYRSLLAKMEQKAKDDFVAPINGLHESPAAIRFRTIQQLRPEDLYYVAVLTDGLIYTSSYTDGVYPLMMKKAGNKGDELLKKLNFDHYRKFIAQAAAYNTLKNFLGTFQNQDDAKSLMTTFVSNLEKSEGLEDGVDVADSYASVYEILPDLAKQMLSDVSQNLDRNQQSGNRKGVAIYSILYNLFLSADSSNHIDLTEKLHVPPVYDVPFKSLANEKGEVICQVFFYGDQDGRNIFNGFLGMFNSNWKIDRSNKQWVVIRSTKGNPVSIYANRPLDETKGEDDAAQRALNAYLEENNLYPTVTIHRGHSYWAPSTIDYMSPTSKLVFMGSCGGFNLIDSILRKSEDAHIIASKQIGKTAINKPFFLLLTEKLRTGKDIEWIPFWKEFKRAANVPGFEDYIPPYKNLGAIFIKAYKRETGQTNV